MTWFRVDDGFYSHPKVIRIPRSVRAEAIGTWSLCGTWSADKELDGYVPAFMVDELGGTEAGAQALVDVRLWKAVRRGEGYQFVNWAEWQPTREQLAEKRRAESQRKAEYRARKARDDAAGSAGVPSGQKRDPDNPSRPVPSLDDDDQQLPGHPHVRSGLGRDDLSPTVSAVVDNVAEHCGRKLHPLAAHDVIDWLEGRRGPNAKPIQNGPRYYARAIRDSAFEVQQFIDEKGLAS